MSAFPLKILDPPTVVAARESPPMRLRHLALLCVSITFVGTSRAAGPFENVSSAPPRSPAEELKTFRLPPGFVAELVAAEPDIHKPLNLAFDDRGRLWITDTLEYPFPVPEGTPGRDGVKILDDFAPDGRARSITTFTTGLNIPIGLLPYPGGRRAVVHSIPNIFDLEDTDGDGKADRKTPMYQTFGFRDTHGMTNAFTWGFDGWIYACHGFSNESTVRGSDQKPITMQSGNTYRMRPDGSHLEYVTHGQVNPFGLAFDPLGNLYSCDCHSRPLYQLLRGAWYPSFGKPHDGLGFGPEMCSHDHGSTAIAGIVFYAADHFPEAYRGTTFIGNVVTNRINHDRISWSGSSPRAVEQPDFLVSDDPWFRPVDLELGPDGALYVADFYNRIIGHYEVPLTHPGRDRERGRIWRIVYRGQDGANPLAAPRRDWTSATFSDLVNDLGHANLTVRLLAANQAASRTPDAASLDTLTKATADENAARRAHALWILQRWSKLDEKTLLKATRDADRLVRVHALRILAEQSEPSDTLMEAARAALSDADADVRRAGAEVLGRHPSRANLRPLLALRGAFPTTERLGGNDDTHLVHVVRMALRDQLLTDDGWAAVESTPLNDREEGDLADVAPGVPTPRAARFLMSHLARVNDPPQTRARFVHHIARYGDPATETTLFDHLENAGDGLASQVDTFKAFQQGLQERGAALSGKARDWALRLASRSLERGNPGEVNTALALVGSLKLIELRERLITLVNASERPENLRAEALAALLGIEAKTAMPIVTSVLTDPKAPAGLRERAAALLGSSGAPESVNTLVAALPTAPARIQGAIAAALVARKPGAEALLDTIGAGKASARLLQEIRVAGPLGTAGIPNLSDRLAKLLHGLPPADARLNALIATRKAGFDMARVEASDGAKLFETHCAVCHQLGGKGAKVGPQLDGVGLRGVDRLLEDVLDPGRNVDQTFRVTNLAMKDGRVVSGLLLREEGEVLVLADAQGKEVRVQRGDVEERSMAPLSPMPANFSEQLPEADFYRLIAYLLSQRPAK